MRFATYFWENPILQTITTNYRFLVIFYLRPILLTGNNMRVDPLSTERVNENVKKGKKIKIVIVVGNIV